MVNIQDPYKTCAYFLISFDELTIECQDFCGLLYELSNNGAKRQLENLLEKTIAPVVVETAQVKNFLLS